VVTDCLFFLFLSAVVPSWAYARFPLTSWKNVKVRIADVLSDYVSESFVFYLWALWLIFIKSLLKKNVTLNGVCTV